MSAAMTRRRKTVSSIDTEIARLKEQRREVRQKSAERFTRIALETGLADLDISDEEITKAFKTLAGRFRGPAAEPKRPPGETTVSAGDAVEHGSRTHTPG